MKIIIGVSIAVVVLILVVIGAFAVMGPAASGGGGGGGTTVRIEPVTVGELVEVVSAPGQVEPVTNVAISARVSARIAEIPFAEGEHVTKGDPDADPPISPSLLLRLDATDLQALLTSAQARRDGQAAQIEVEESRIEGQVASLVGTRASMDEAKRDRDRNRDLAASGDVSRTTYEQAQRRYDEQASQYASAEANLEASRKSLNVARFNLKAAEAEIDRAKDSLSYTTMHSPIDGVVTIVNVEPGEMAVTGTMNNPGTVLLEVADLSTMLVVAELDEADVGQVHEGQAARVRMLAYPDRIFKGTVRSVALSATRLGTKFFKTEILLKTDGEQIYSGLTADAEIEVKRHTDVLTIPSQAVMGRPIDDLPVDIRDSSAFVNRDKSIATVVYRFVDGKAVITPVTIGPSDVTHTVILGGLAEDDQVIVGPYKALEGLSHEQSVKDEREDKNKDADAVESDEADDSADDTAPDTPADTETPEGAPSESSTPAEAA